MPIEVYIRIGLSIVILIAIIIILVRFKRRKSEGNPRDSLQLMKERLEKGEITQEEYDEAKRKRGK
ncbi:SHOCT domain-containing protein [Virgibacillus ainsalahensis]